LGHLELTSITGQSISYKLQFYLREGLPEKSKLSQHACEEAHREMEFWKLEVVAGTGNTGN
jgi:hypothetical protein